MSSRWCTVVVDAMDPNRLARWWAQVLDFRLLREASGEVVIGRDDSPRLLFTRVPNVKPDSSRLHIELDPDDRDAELERLLDMGARHVDMGRTGRAPSRIVLADPEGNEFCILSRPER
ncbi:VOC family protein [Rugosimonospora acidiphila]|uniref:VOC family protein n=1 Tax=Rugosimonospora acidiphila TaxID=556531 RepID=A0ABP9RRR0_9ACTN